MICKYCAATFNNMEKGRSHETACTENPKNAGLSAEELCVKAQEYRFRKERWADEQGVPRKKSLIKFLLDNINITGMKKALILGAADPTEKHLLEEAGIEAVVATDLNAHHPEIIKMDMHQIDFPDDEFDLVLASHSLEHAFDPGKVISEIYRVLLCGGVFVCEVPVNYMVDDVDRHDFGTSRDLVDFMQKYGEWMPVAAVDIPFQFPGNFCAGDVVKVIMRVEA